MTRRTLFTLIALASGLALVSYWIGQQSYSWMPVQASAEAILVDNLFSFMVAIASFIVLGVTGTLLYSVLFQRASRYDISDGPALEGNLKLEIVWTAIPLVLVVWIGTYSYQTYNRMSILGSGGSLHVGMPTAMANEIGASPEASAPIEVRSRQWAWEFYYPDRDVTSTELHLPVNQRAQLQLTSEDVLHGFYVPAFRVKQDIIPGRAIAFEFTPIREGRYRLRDSEYSGTYFATNQTHVVVESLKSYQQWLAAAAAQPLTPAENVAYQEFKAAIEKPMSLGWSRIVPAAAPLANYSSSESDSHE
ncbi:heme/copper-type cytochrome/quinol oxidase, subunit 2 [Rubidibacter lacunae KORDI 51-2]|uniref:Cytochrome c oxidase subunit 2 n=1 Tax=Rubidibacter lacunae KORDI 51-2 TaxID=582515 RepID=U5D6A0_9CHRO|nr:cytochrome c oxidase subunit II [Rubidibacter lacunae]ERN40163.1 heme/copper-type cytochrome/quinol oxidase, subunit 2 [Rubidibacter lacunae KORDI 51-2]